VASRNERGRIDLFSSLLFAIFASHTKTTLLSYSLALVRAIRKEACHGVPHSLSTCNNCSITAIRLFSRHNGELLPPTLASLTHPGHRHKHHSRNAPTKSTPTSTRSAWESLNPPTRRRTLPSPPSIRSSSVRLSDAGPNVQPLMTLRCTYLRSHRSTSVRASSSAATSLGVHSQHLGEHWAGQALSNIVF
jgi:hypothetical protein